MEIINFLILLYWWNRRFSSLKRIFMSYLYILTDWSGKLEEITIYLRQKGLCTHFYCIIIYWNRISLYLYKCWLMLFINVGDFSSHKYCLDHISFFKEAQCFPQAFPEYWIRYRSSSSSLLPNEHPWDKKAIIWFFLKFKKIPPPRGVL